ncbi:MAG: hypothetical protein GY711_06065 [bacterium]|nr:hypothetical protein [bacterium]
MSSSADPFERGAIRVNPQLDVFRIGGRLVLHHERGRYACALGATADLRAVLRAAQDGGGAGWLTQSAPRRTRALARALLKAGVLERTNERALERASGEVPIAPARMRAASVLVVGHGAMADAVAGELRRWATVRRLNGPWLGVSSEAECRAARERHLIFSNRELPPAPPPDRACGPSPLAGVDFLVAALEGAPWSALSSLRDEAARADVPLLPVVALGERLRAGPLALPPTRRAFDCSSGGPHGAGLALDEAQRASLARAMCTLVYRGRREVLERFARSVAERMFAGGLPLCWQRIVGSPRAIGTERVPGAWATWIGSEESEHSSLTTYLDPGIRDDSRRLADVRAALEAGELVTIHDALRADFAQAVWEDLDRCTAWKLHEGTYPGPTPFSYRHHNVYELSHYPPSLLTAFLVFGSPATRRWASALSGRDCDGEVALSASHYRPGDHSTAHNDRDGERQVAFVWHLTKDWPREWGGGLFWAPTGHELRPSFNTLSLFNVSQDSQHCVRSVAAAATGKRLCVNGWWRRHGT